jgi:hypothetical protein
MNHVFKTNISKPDTVRAIKFEVFPFQSSMEATREHKTRRGDTCQVNSFYGQIYVLNFLRLLH